MWVDLETSQQASTKRKENQHVWNYVVSAQLKGKKVHAEYKYI